MPEVVELKKYHDFLTNKLSNTRLCDINILSGRYSKNNNLPGFELFKKDTVMLNCFQKGKFLYLEFGDFKIAFTFGLYGGFSYNNNIILDDYYDYDVKKYYRIKFIFQDNNELIFFDKNSWGTISIVDKKYIDTKLQKLGPDVFDIELPEFNKLIEKTKNKNEIISLFLVEQKTISGIGNYLRSEILWFANIDPFVKICELNETDIVGIYLAIKTIIWVYYDYDQGLKLAHIIDNLEHPSKYKKSYYIYSEKSDIYNNKVHISTTKKGKDVRKVYYI